MIWYKQMEPFVAALDPSTAHVSAPDKCSTAQTLSVLEFINLGKHKNACHRSHGLWNIYIHLITPEASPNGPMTNEAWLLTYVFGAISKSELSLHIKFATKNLGKIFVCLES